MAKNGQIKNLVSGTWTTEINLYQPDTAPGADARWPVYDFSWQGLDPGTIEVQRQLAESSYVDGFLESQNRSGPSNYTFKFMITGRSSTVLDSNIATLVAALSKAFQLWTSPDGTRQWAWQCARASLQLGFEAAHEAGVWAPLVATGIRQPIPLAGAV